MRRFRRFRLRWRRDVAAAAGSMLTAEEILLHHLLAVRKSVTSCLARARRLRLAGEKRVVQRQQRRGQGADVVGRGLGGRFGSSDQKEESESDSGSGSGGDDAADVPTSVRHRAFSLACYACALSFLKLSSILSRKADSCGCRARAEKGGERLEEGERKGVFFLLLLPVRRRRSEGERRKSKFDSLNESFLSLVLHLAFFHFQNNKNKKVNQTAAPGARRPCSSASSMQARAGE